MNVISPATSRNARPGLEEPTVATGTFTVTVTVAEPQADATEAVLERDQNEASRWSRWPGR